MSEENVQIKNAKMVKLKRINLLQLEKVLRKKEKLD